MILRKFIVFEGIDGAGTSTQIGELKKRQEAGRFLFTAEPSENETGKFLRRMLRGDIGLENSTAAYLFAADRNEHLHGKLRCEGNTLISGIETACRDGKTVVSDRYLFSSLAYQSIGPQDCRAPDQPGLPQLLNSSFPLPQLLFYFDIDPSVSLRRINGRETKEIYEKEEFLRQAAAAYKAAIKTFSRNEPDMKVVILDATKGIADISEIIWNEIGGLEA